MSAKKLICELYTALVSEERFPVAIYELINEYYAEVYHLPRPQKPITIACETLVDQECIKVGGKRSKGQLILKFNRRVYNPYIEIEAYANKFIRNADCWFCKTFPWVARVTTLISELSFGIFNFF